MSVAVKGRWVLLGPLRLGPAVVEIVNLMWDRPEEFEANGHYVRHRGAQLEFWVASGFLGLRACGRLLHLSLREKWVLYRACIFVQRALAFAAARQARSLPIGSKRCE